MLSITDFVISQVLTTVDGQTLPVCIISGLRGAISPALGAVSAFFIGALGPSPARAAEQARSGSLPLPDQGLR